MIIYLFINARRGGVQVFQFGRDPEGLVLTRQSGSSVFLYFCFSFFRFSDSFRFFYKHVWRQWDEEDEDDDFDYFVRCVEARLRR